VVFLLPLRRGRHGHSVYLALRPCRSYHYMDWLPAWSGTASLPLGSFCYQVGSPRGGFRVLLGRVFSEV
jgi:hypothetical protein